MTYDLDLNMKGGHMGNQCSHIILGQRSTTVMTYFKDKGQTSRFTSLPIKIVKEI